MEQTAQEAGPSTLPVPSAPPAIGDATTSTGAAVVGQARKGMKGNKNNHKKFAYPLPIICPLPLPTPSFNSRYNNPNNPNNPNGPNNSNSPSGRSGPTLFQEVGSVLQGYIPQIINPSVEIPIAIGRYDPITRSVWITNPRDVAILFNRGFFGKGSLSRSEMNWRDRRIDMVIGGESALAEQIREKRRAERKAFKLERAAAMLDAAKMAEEVLTTTLTAKKRAVAEATAGSSQGQEEMVEESNTTIDTSLESGQDQMEETLVEQQEVIIDGGGDKDDMSDFTDIFNKLRLTSRTPSSSTTATLATTTTTAPTTNAVSLSEAGDGIDVTKLTPQTFLVRPTRPDTNRNRGKKAFKRKTKPSTPAVPAISGQDPSEVPTPISVSTEETIAAVIPESEKPVVAEPGKRIGEVEDDEKDGEILGPAWDEVEGIVEEAEHLQLGLEEAWFLRTALGVLKVYDPLTDSYPPAEATLPLFLTPLDLSSPPPADPTQRPDLRPDDPFLVSYVAYHYFRSLGWVVKPGIKFCCDWLLYRKGPAFSHSAFACVVVPVYEDQSDKETSPYRNEDWYEERQSWKWINTVMRVNALVQKTVIMVYVTIPALSTFSERHKLSNGNLDYTTNSMRSLLERYHVQEVSMQRFSPARRRD